MPVKSANPQAQIDLFKHACKLIGSHREIADRLGCGHRTIAALCAGEREIHAGWLEDISRLLIEKADECRRVERQLMPGFRANLTEAQAAARPDRKRVQERRRDQEQADGQG